MKRIALVLAVSAIAFTSPALAFEPPNQSEKLDAATFVKEAACGGKLEIKLGELATKQAESAEVKKFAEQMIADHTKAGKKLMEVAQSANLEVPKQLSEKHEAVCEKLKQIDSASFDREYMKCMVKDHKEAVMLFEKGSKSENEEVKAFASATLPTIKEHLKLAKEIASQVGIESEDEKK